MTLRPSGDYLAQTSVLGMESSRERRHYIRSYGSSSIPGLLPNREWLGLVDRLLDGTELERAAARETMWVEVQRYVVRCVRLPIGPLADDLEVRLDVAIGVLRRLEQDDFRHVRTWRERQRSGQDSAPWWSLIWTMTKRMAIDAARGSRQNLARRDEEYRWARIVLIDPAVFEVAQRDALGRSLDFLEQASEQDLRGYLASQQGMFGSDAEGEAERGGGEPPAVAAAVKPETNGGSGPAR